MHDTIGSVMVKPLVSIIIPTYNRANVLARSIYSVLNQTYNEIEVIVVDDSSTDSTIEIITGINDPRLKLIRLPINSGPSAARNAGIKASTGEYIAFQDSDDEWFEEKLEKQMHYLGHAITNDNRVAACYSRYLQTFKGKKQVFPPGQSADLSGSIYESLLYKNKISPTTLLIRKKALDDVGYFDETLNKLEDWDLALRIAARFHIAFLDEVTVVVHDSFGSVNKLISPESELAILQKHLIPFRSTPEAFAIITCSIGLEYAKQGNKREATKFLKMSLERYVGSQKPPLCAAISLCVKLFLALLSVRRTLKPLLPKLPIWK